LANVVFYHRALAKKSLFGEKNVEEIAFWRNLIALWRKKKGEEIAL